MSSGPPFDQNAAKRFLAALDPQSKFHTFQTFGDRDKIPGLVRVFHGSFDDFGHELAKLNERGAGAYVTVNRTNLEGRSTEDITAPRAAFVDFDNVDPPQGAGALPPSVIVQSKRGKHLYWMLEPGESLPEWELLQAALAKKMGSDDSCVDRPRVMRLPGSDHRKGDPFRVELVECHPERRYTIDVIARAYGLDLTPPPPKPILMPKAGGDGPADDFNLRGDWSMLEKHGWVQCGSKGDDTHWRRPGKDRGQLSGTTDHEGRTGIFYCFSSAAPPFQANQGYTRFQVFAMLEHGGNSQEAYQAAAKALVAQGYGGQDRDRWLKQRLREEADALWESRFEAGPPPDALGGPPADVIPIRPEGGWGAELAPPPHSDADAPDTGGDPPKKGKGKGGKGGRKKGGGKRKPNLKDPQDDLCSFRVSETTIFESEESLYHLEIEGHTTLRLTHKELFRPTLFGEKYFGRIGNYPTIPYEDRDAWQLLVNYWTSDALATRIAQPPEADESGSQMTAIRGVLRRMTAGDALSDMDRSHVLPHPDRDKAGWFIFKADTLRREVRSQTGDPIKENALCAWLRLMGAKPDRVRIGHVRLRCWRFKYELDDPEGWSDPDTESTAVGDQSVLPIR